MPRELDERPRDIQAPATAEGPAPGKVTLTSGLPVQRKAKEAPGGADPPPGGGGGASAGGGGGGDAARPRGDISYVDQLIGESSVVQRKVVQRKEETGGGAAPATAPAAAGPAAAAAGPAAVASEKGGGLQPTRDIEALYAQAAAANGELQGHCTAIAAATKGAASPGPLKGRERAMQKVKSDYGGDASYLYDIARATITYESFKDLQAGVKLLQGLGLVVRGKDRFEKPTDAGYRDMLMNLRMSNGHIVELQLNLKQIVEVKKGEGHKIYEKIREIEANAKGRDMTKDEQKQIEDLNAQSRALYDDAMDQAMGGDR